MKRIAYTLLGLLALWVLPASAASQSGAAATETPAQWQEAASQLSTNPKITDRHEAMKAFERGDGVGRFIVMLRQPEAAASANADLSVQAGKELRRLEVQSVREAAMSRMPELPASVVRHSYDNIFGFSVNVTPDQLETILANPDVQSVEPSRIVKAHLRQGIPLEAAS